MDSNHRPTGYEPAELPLLYATMYYFKELIFLYLYIYEYREKISKYKKYFWWRWRESNPRPNTDLINLIHKLSTFFLMYKIYSLYFPA